MRPTMTQRLALTVTMLGAGLWWAVAGAPAAATQAAGGCATPSFAPAQNFGANGAVSGVTSGDFNGDNKPDLAAASLSEDTVSVLFGDGQGGFAAAVNFGVGNNPQSVTTGDFNGDDKPDLATANTSSDRVSVLLNDCGESTASGAQDDSHGVKEDAPPAVFAPAADKARTRRPISTPPKPTGATTR